MEKLSSHLTLEEAFPIIADSITDGTILVGGQAVNLWAVIFDIRTASPFLTRDIDLVGGQSDAELANRQIKLPHKLYLASQDDASINSAVIEVMFPGDEKTRPIDYLMTLYGLDRDKIEASAIEVEFNSIKIRVIHPILLMHSKICNLSLQGKQNAEALEQTLLTIQIVREFFKDALEGNDVSVRQMLKLFKYIINISKGEHGVFAYNKFNIDAISSIPVANIGMMTNSAYVNFLEKGLPIAMRQVNKFRGIHV